MKLKKCVPNFNKKTYDWLKRRLYLYAISLKRKSFFLKVFNFFSFIIEKDFLVCYYKKFNLKVLLNNTFIFEKKDKHNLFIFLQFFALVFYEKFEVKFRLNSDKLKFDNKYFKQFKNSKLLRKKKYLTFKNTFQNFLQIYFFSSLKFIKQVFFYFYIFDLWKNVLKKTFYNWLLESMLQNIQNCYKKKLNLLYNVIIFIYKKFLYKNMFKKIKLCNQKKDISNMLLKIKILKKLNVIFQSKKLIYFFFIFKNSFKKDFILIKNIVFFYSNYFFFIKKFEIFFYIIFIQLYFFLNFKSFKFIYSQYDFKITINKKTTKINNFLKNKTNIKNEKISFFFNRKYGFNSVKIYFIWNLLLLSLVNFLNKKNCKIKWILFFFNFVESNFEKNFKYKYFKRNKPNLLKIKKIVLFYNNFSINKFNRSRYFNLLVLDFFYLKNFLKLYFINISLLQFLFKILKNNTNVIFKNKNFYKEKKDIILRFAIKFVYVCKYRLNCYFEFLVFNINFFAFDFIKFKINKNFLIYLFELKFIYMLLFMTTNMRKNLKKINEIKKNKSLVIKNLQNMFAL
jgi:hypothetical protein